MLKTQDKIFKLLNYCIYYISGTNLDQLPLQLIMGNYISQYLLGFLLSRVLSMHVRGGFQLLDLILMELKSHMTC